MVEGRLRRGDRPDRTRWLPDLAASRERLVVSAVQPASSGSS
jgi:hypothetical protein